MRKSMVVAASLLLLVVAVVLVATPETTEQVAEPPAYTVAVERDDAEAPEPPPTEAAQMPTQTPEPEGELLTPSKLTAAELEAGLLGELKPYAKDFIAAERETGVSAVFLAAVAACVKSLYLTPDGAYFNGYAVEAVNTRYNGAEHWEKKVKQIMQEIKERIEGSANNEQ